MLMLRNEDDREQILESQPHDTMSVMLISKILANPRNHVGVSNTLL